MRYRKTTKGFVLLDALIAFAIAMLATTLILTALPTTAVRQTVRLDEYLAHEFAFSVLEEYRVTFPQMPTEGVDPSGWEWSLEEVPVEAEPNSQDIPIEIVEITVVASHRDSPASRATITAKFARLRE